MTTTSANIAPYMVPIGEPIERLPSGFVYDVKRLTNKKKAKKKTGVYEIFAVDGHMMIESAVEKKSVVNGKKGVWRTISGRHYFFPDDKSGSIPPFKWGK
jgi:hypothetical protein